MKKIRKNNDKYLKNVLNDNKNFYLSKIMKKNNINKM